MEASNFKTVQSRKTGEESEGPVYDILPANNFVYGPQSMISALDKSMHMVELLPYDHIDKLKYPNIGRRSLNNLNHNLNTTATPAPATSAPAHKQSGCAALL